jgi:hypothetical protein
MTFSAEPAGQDQGVVVPVKRTAGKPKPSPSDGRYVPSDAEREGIRSDIRALPPLSDQDIEDLAVIILDAREQRASAASETRRNAEHEGEHPA